MCVYCDSLPYKNWECHFGEGCARMAGLVKRYDEKLTAVAAGCGRAATLSASLVLNEDADWEHPIPGMVIRRAMPNAYVDLYERGLVVALNRTTHRNHVMTSGGGLHKKAFRENIVNLFAEGQWNQAVFELIQSDVNAIQQCYRGSSYASDIPMGAYVPALGAVLLGYRKKEIITDNALFEIYSWVCEQLLPFGTPRRYELG